MAGAIPTDPPDNSVPSCQQKIMKAIQNIRNANALVREGYRNLQRTFVFFVKKFACAAGLLCCMYVYNNGV